MTAAAVRVEARGPVRVVILDRPERLNAFDAAMHEGLADALEIDDGAAAVVLTGAGRAFSAGGDRDVIASLDDETVAALGALAERQTRGIVESPVPVVAAVNGPAIGYAASLVAFCDLVVMADDAFLCDPHVSMGMEPSVGCITRWPLRAPPAVVDEIVRSGRRVGAAEALRLGLVDLVVPAAEVVDAAVNLATAR